MNHITLSTAQPSVRRVDATPGTVDPRWHVLDLVRVCRLRLDLTDRDIAVLRGLLSLLPVGEWGQQMVVFASNRVLAARCDDIEERTLRRRLNHLVERGLVARKFSPSGKRYRVKDGDSACVLTYGIDLTPLYAVHPHLETLAADCRYDGLRVCALKSLLRDRLYHHADLETLGETARLALRRKASSDDLQALLDQIDQFIARSQPVQAVVTRAEPEEMSTTYGQNVRHIQSSNKERSDSDAVEDQQAGAESKVLTNKPVTDISVDQCMEAATTARSLSACPPQTWHGVVVLAKTLAPGIGLDPQAIRAAEDGLGEFGSALAVLGRVEAFDRIRNPQAYLNMLVKKAEACGLDCVRMFRSLTQAKQGQKTYG